jgi:hypothetical protein
VTRGSFPYRGSYTLEFDPPRVFRGSTVVAGSCRFLRAAARWATVLKKCRRLYATGIHAWVEDLNLELVTAASGVVKLPWT